MIPPQGIPWGMLRHFKHALPFFWCFQVLAQDTLPNALLWRVESTEGGLAGYVFGTIHSRDDRAFQFGDSLLPALYKCPQVAGELDPSEVASSSMALLSRMQLPAGGHLQDLYSKRDWKKVSAALEAKLGPMATMMHRTKPLFILAMLTEMDMSGTHERVLDDHLLHMAAENGQQVSGLETVAEQVSALDALPLKQQAALLLEHVRHPEAGWEQLERMHEAYAEQDLQRLMTLVQETGALPEELERSLLDERNARMVQRMDVLMRIGDACFFAVGAAHLPGASGVITGLRGSGWRVVAVQPR